jgi:hypothetical protein
MTASLLSMSACKSQRICDLKLEQPIEGSSIYGTWYGIVNSTDIYMLNIKNNRTATLDRVFLAGLADEKLFHYSITNWSIEPERKMVFRFDVPELRYPSEMVSTLKNGVLTSVISNGDYGWQDQILFMRPFEIKNSVYKLESLKN